MITAEERAEFERLARPLVEFINNNCNPHAMIVIECDNAKLYSGEMSFYTEDYIKD
jgi:hypothetical protein